MPVLTLPKEGRTIEVPQGANLRRSLRANGISPYSGIDRVLNCMGNGLCGTCRVEVADGKGASPMAPMEEGALVGFIPFYARSVPKNPMRVGIPASMAACAGPGDGSIPSTGTPSATKLRKR